MDVVCACCNVWQPGGSTVAISRLGQPARLTSVGCLPSLAPRFGGLSAACYHLLPLPSRVCGRVLCCDQALSGAGRSFKQENGAVYLGLLQALLLAACSSAAPRPAVGAVEARRRGQGYCTFSTG